jgi:FlaG/FlaF family flagellin (archaellin)
VIRGFAPALLSFLFLLGSEAVADVAATGTFDIQLAGSPPTVPVTGDITFDAGVRSALGWEVSMAADVGDMSFEGDAVVDAAQKSATFDLSAASGGDFAFTTAGSARCQSAGCVNGRGTFVGRLSLTDPDDVLRGGIFTLDGTAVIDANGMGTAGAFAINAFPLTLTRVGSDTSVSSGPQTFFDTRAGGIRAFVADARFASVGVAGATQFVAFSALPGALPPGIELDGALSVFVDVATNAMVSGGVHLCLGYPDANDDQIVDGTTVAVSRIRLLHAAAIGAAFTDVTASVAGQRACGDVPAVGPIVLGVAEAALTTTTTTPGPGATTTTTTASSPTTTTLPACGAALECVDVAVAGPLCPGETLNQKLATLIRKKLGKARAALLSTRTTSAAKKLARLVAKARKQLGRIGTKADAFVSRRNGAISPECRDLIRGAMGRVTQQIDANRI